MRILITSDIHFGVPNKLQHSIWAAKVIREYAHQQDIEVVLVLGDLFHDRNSLNIQVLSDAYDFFDELDQKYDQEWVAFPGNHDMFLKNSWKVNSVRPLSRLITIVEDIKMLNIGGAKFWVIPFVHYENAFMQAVRAIEAKASPDDILLTHIGVTGASLNECFLLKHWSLIDFADTKFKRIYSGHFHCFQQVGTKTWYPGSPIPFRFDEGLVEHGFIEYDTETNDHKFIKTFEQGKLLLPNEQRPPDYITCMDTSHDKMDVDGNNVRIVQSREYTANEMQEMKLAIMARGAIGVKFMKTKQDKDVALVAQSNTNIGDGVHLFEKWLTHDKPDHIDKDAMIGLNKQIVEEGEERLASTEDPDAE